MLRRYLPPTLVIATGFLLWELCVRAFNLRIQVLPSPLVVLHSGWADRAVLGWATLTTVAEGLAGTVCAIFAALLVAYALHLSPALSRAFSPLLVVSQTIPLVAVAPLLVIWFGFGPGAKVLLVAVYGFFPIAIAFLQGLRDVPPELVDVARTWGRSRTWILWRIESAHASPQFFAGLRITSAYTFATAAMAEFVGAKYGLGVYLLSAQASYRTDLVFAGAFVLCVSTLLFFGFVLLLQRVALSPAQRQVSQRHLAQAQF